MGQNSLKDPRIEQWHHNFEEVRRVWVEWCLKNATNYDTASQAWDAFVEDQRQHQSHINFGNVISNPVH